MIVLVSDSLTTFLNVVTAIGTAGAAIAAAWAVRRASEIATMQDDRAVERDRFAAAVSLLEAFDKLQTLRYETDPSDSKEDHTERMVQALAAEGEFKARLRASEEPLELTRKVMFMHEPPSDDVLTAAVQRLGWHGNPELESIAVIAIRAEIVDVLNRRRPGRAATTDVQVMKPPTLAPAYRLYAQKQVRAPEKP
ncbi:hypothetical protein OHA18_20240 [Kribbella sp. NBC_00709]|uniref:hypothetical protein n=1 Tax=Kribbella sp. NBC_00709 TaxID=2975972 RepID=UPI002E2C65EF|nr:hypothetical protein [Kribbella sp. NBC_00709]